MPFLLLLLTSLCFASPREELQILLSKWENESEAITRLNLYSQEFLDLPYGDKGPLGEGYFGRYDQDPLYRFDTFDCTTFVETALALALSREPQEFENTLRKIRYYKGQIDYLFRNHFPSLQWIPYNIQNGFLKEINTLILPQSELALAEATINIPGWLKATKLSAIQIPEASDEEKTFLLNELQSLAQFYSPIKASLHYVPIQTLLDRPKLLNAIPSGSIVNFVRPNWDLTDVIGTHMNVSHQGFLFWKKSVLYLRHASTYGDRKVAELPFLDYLKHFVNHATMKGVHFMGLNLTPLQ